MAVPTNDIQANNLLNRLDPPKDALDGGVLNNGVHGPYIVARLDELFPPPIMGQSGVGDTKQTMITAIFNYLPGDIIEQTKQQLVRLKFSTNGVDNRYAGMFVAHDAGPAPSHIFLNNYTLVLTPGSILDPAAKIKPVGIQSNTASITQANRFSNAELVPIAMNTAFGGDIEFTPGPAATPYQFTLPFIGNVSFDAGYNAVGQNAQFFAGNVTKNRFIAGAVQNGTPANHQVESRKYILAKEIGDTLQVCWLKFILTIAGFPSEEMDTTTTAIMTNDKVVWLRALLNRVNVLLSTGQIVTLYPSDNTAEGIAAGVVRMKQNTLDELKRNNDAVIDMFNNMLAPAAGSTFEGIDYTVAGPLQIQFMGVLTRIRDYLTEHYRDIIAMLSQLPAVLTYDQFKVIAIRYYFTCPFVQRRGEYKYVRNFKGFLPFVSQNDFIGRKLTLEPQNLYGILRTGRSPEAINNILRGLWHTRVPMVGGARTKLSARLAMADLRSRSLLYTKPVPKKPDEITIGQTRISVSGLIEEAERQEREEQRLPDWLPAIPWPAGAIVGLQGFIDNPVNVPALPPLAPRVAINPNPYTATEFAYIASLWNDPNIVQSGFITAYMITHFPEILHIGYALYRNRQPFTVLFGQYGPNIFSQEIAESITDAFTNLDDTTFTNYVDPATRARFATYDTYVRGLCQLAEPMVLAFIGGGQYTTVLADVTALNARAQPIVPVLAPAPVPTFDEMLVAWGEYQSLYFAETILTRLNIRDRVDPYDVLKYMSSRRAALIMQGGGARRTRRNRRANRRYTKTRKASVAVRHRRTIRRRN